jgi:hypothetical protein
MKGWMQTWCVHMRRPWKLWCDTGWRGLLALNLVVGGSVLTALVHPLLLLELILGLARRVAYGPPEIYFDAVSALHLLTILAGYAGSAIVAAIGLSRRGRLRDAWCLGLLPFYWIALSIAAWRALGQFVWTPYQWEKTEHGLVKRASPQQPRRQPQARRASLRDSA